MKKIFESIANDKEFVKYIFLNHSSILNLPHYTKLSREYDYITQNISEELKPAFSDKLLLYKNRIRHSKNDTDALYKAYYGLIDFMAQILRHTAITSHIPFIHYVQHDGKIKIGTFITYDKKAKVSADTPYVEPGSFSNCPVLNELEFEEGFDYIPPLFDIFSRIRLEKVVIPASVTKLSDSAFWGCESLEEVIFKGDNTIFSSKTFKNTPWFKKLPDGMQIRAGTLFWCDTDEETVIIPEGVKHIGEYVFDRCKIKDLQLPKSLLTLGKCAFYNCKNLEKVVIPENVIYIDEECFDGCNNLKEVWLPKNVDIKNEYRVFDDRADITFYGYKKCPAMEKLVKTNRIKYQYID